MKKTKISNLDSEILYIQLILISSSIKHEIVHKNKAYYKTKKERKIIQSFLNKFSQVIIDLDYKIPFKALHSCIHSVYFYQ